MIKNLRKRQVQKMIDDLATEGLQIGYVDEVMLQAYIDESICGLDLLAQARQFPTMAEYHDWWLDHQEACFNNPSPTNSAEYVMSEFKDCLRRKHATASTVSEPTIPLGFMDI